MNEIFLFFTQFVIAYLLLGCLLTSVIALALRLLTLNAAARHRIWLTSLIVLVLAPVLSLLPDAAPDNPYVTPLNENPALATTVMKEFSLGIEEAQVLEAVKLESAVMSGGILSASVAVLNSGSLSLEALSRAFVEFPLSRQLAISIFLLLALGVGAKLLLYIHAVRALRVLVDSSEAVEGEWAAVLEHCSKTMCMSRRIELRNSNGLSTPSTCGVLKPCIILPSAMVRDGSLVGSRAQVLQHELAHIKRRDPLIAGLQAIVSVLLFWHPAVNYVNKKIRYEREIACDDWVVSNSTHGDNAGIKAYAYSIVGIAESLSVHSSPAHSVACVNNSLGLQERIRILLDRRADHSTSVNLMPNVWVASLALGFMFFASALLPKLPSSIFQQSIELEVVSLPTLPATPTITPRELDGVVLQIEPITFSIEPGVQQIAEYEVPLPILDFVPSLEADESSAVLSRAARIESTFDSKAVEMTRVNTLAREMIKPILDRVAPVSLDELVDQQADFSSDALAFDDTYAESNDLVIIDSLSRAELAREILKIELELYRVFNSVTDRDDLKMYCDTETILGSYIGQTTCEPEFLRTARSENISISMGTARMNQINTSVGLSKDMKAEYAELAGEILKEMKSNQYLLELYQVLAGLRGRLVELA